MKTQKRCVMSCLTEILIVYRGLSAKRLQLHFFLEGENSGTEIAIIVKIAFTM